MLQDSGRAQLSAMDPLASGPGCGQSPPVRALRILLKDAIRDAETIFPASTAALPTAARYLNAAELGDELFARALLCDIYQAREIAFEPVRLGRVPDALMLGGDSYWVLAGDVPIHDQISPDVHDVARVFRELRELPLPVEDVERPCLLVARYGDVTWGHWLCEILPRAVVAERAYPGRFRYVIPQRITHPGEVRGYADAVLESLAAYGIREDRLLRVRVDRHYRFRELYAVTPLWSSSGNSAAISPAVLQMMRDALPPRRYAWPARLAFLRRDTSTRNIFNTAELSEWLSDKGFVFVEMAKLSFLEQVDAFRCAERIFGVRGSGMSGLMYSPDGVRVISAAPGAWPDAYFYMLIQFRRGLYADIRGSVIWDGEGLERDAPFFVHRKHFDAAFAALEQPEEGAGAVIPIGNVELVRDLNRKLTEIVFSNTGNADKYLGQGWLAPEPGLIWSMGQTSTLRLPFPYPQGEYLLEIEAIGLVAPPYFPARQLDIRVNGIPAGSFPVVNFSRITCRLPASAQNSGWLDIEFRHPFCLSLRTLGKADDDRPLAVAFKVLRLWSA